MKDDDENKTIIALHSGGLSGYLDMRTDTKLNYLVSHFAHKLDFHQS